MHYRYVILFFHSTFNQCIASYDCRSLRENGIDTDEATEGKQDILLSLFVNNNFDDFTILHNIIYLNYGTDFN